MHSPRQKKSGFNQRQRRRAFTLVEMLIVVVTMSIVAGAVLPQVTSVIEDGKSATMRESVHEMQFAIERYKLDHGGVPPTALGLLVVTTNFQGVYSSTGSYGPYVDGGQIPLNPLANTRNVTNITSFPTDAVLEGAAGWVYYPGRGQVWGGLATSVPAPMSRRLFNEVQ